MARLFKNLLDENKKTDETNSENYSTKDLNCIINDIDIIKKAQTDMSNKLDLLIEKLNNEQTSNSNNSIASTSVFNSNGLTGAKKRKFNNSNNKQNFISNDWENLSNKNNNNEEIEEFDVTNPQNRLETFNNNSNNENEIEEIEVRQENSGDLNNNDKLNKNEIKPSINTQQQSHLFDIDASGLLNEPHIAEKLNLDSYNDFKPPIYKMNDSYYVDDNLSMIAYSKSKSRRNFAAQLTKLVFTPRERLESNCNGRNGKNKLDINRLQVIRNTLFKYYPCKQSTLVLDGDTISTGDNDENTVWFRDCIPAVDESNRVLKKQVIAWHKKHLSSNDYSNMSNSCMNFNQTLNTNCFNDNSFIKNNQNNNLNYLSDENSNNNNNNYRYDCEDGFEDFYD
jgi:hypothetical protein